MGKRKEKYVIISGLNFRDNNRGTAALGYGSISFLAQRHGLTPDVRIVRLQYVKKFWKKMYREQRETVRLASAEWNVHTVSVFELEKWMVDRWGVVIPFTRLGRILRDTKYVAAINGGDGFSDIYGTATFLSRLNETNIAMKLGLPVIQLPQTLGPFKGKSNYNIAEKILRYADTVYVRDEKFVDELNAMGVRHELTNDLSAFMEPEPFDIEIKEGAVGLNISGLTYFNRFRTLAGQFENYPALVKGIVGIFQAKGVPVYLIPHSYDYNHPAQDEDDILAMRAAYDALDNKTGVYKVDADLISPRQKYVISRMSFFIGTRMHANFAAIFTNVPVFGLAYSYKFEGAFNRNGLYGQTAMINNLAESDIPAVLEKIMNVYERTANKS